MQRVLPAVTFALGAAALGAGAGSGASAACKAGVTKVNSIDARAFCGPAKATVHYGTKLFTYTQGDCENSSKDVVVNIGTVMLGLTTRPKPNYFGLLVGTSAGGKAAARDGTYTGGVLALVYGGKGYVVRTTSLKIAIAGGRTRGTFTGVTRFDNPPSKVTGSFHC